MSVSAAFETVHPVYFLEASLPLLSPPSPLHSLKLTATGAGVRMTSLTVCISMCHSASKACIRIFVTISMSALFAPGSSALAARSLAGPQWVDPLPGSSSLFHCLIKILI